MPTSAFHHTVQQAALALAATCLAVPGHAADWVGAGASVEGDARIELSKTFGHRAGTFKAMPESVTDQRTSIKGDFIVGTYRYLYNTPQQEHGRMVDEAVFTELMDCQGKFYGTLKQTSKLRGKVVAEKTTAPGDVLMTQTGGPTVDARLCALHAGGAPAPAARNATANPDYRPGAMTAGQADALLDKYAPDPRKK